MKHRNKVQSAFMIIILAVIWGVCAGFASYLYMDGSRYPAEMVGTDRMRDAMYGIYAITGAAFLFSVIWFYVWKAFRKNQKNFDSTLTAQELAAPHSWLDASLPLSLQGNTLRINRGFSILVINICDIGRIHSYIPWFWRGRGLPMLAVDICTLDKKKHKAGFDYGNAPGVKDILEKIRRANPHIVIQDEYFESAAVRSHLFYQQFKGENAKRKAAVRAGQLTEEQYTEWLRQQKAALDKINQ